MQKRKDEEEKKSDHQLNTVAISKSKMGTITALRKIRVGVEQVAEGYQKQAQGLREFEEVVASTNQSYLADIVKSMLQKENQAADPKAVGPADPVDAHAPLPKPKKIIRGGKTVYACPKCDFPPRAGYNTVKGHINQTHSKTLLICDHDECNFSCYNPDVLGRHVMMHETQ